MVGRLLFPWRLLRAVRHDAPVLWTAEGVAAGEPSEGAALPLHEGSVVKLGFERVWPSAVERLWVRVVEVGEEADEGWLVGRVDCEPYRLRRPRFGDEVRFTRAHVVEPGARELS